MLEVTSMYILLEAESNRTDAWAHKIMCWYAHTTAVSLHYQVEIVLRLLRSTSGGFSHTEKGMFACQGFSD